MLNQTITNCVNGKWFAYRKEWKEGDASGWGITEKEALEMLLLKEEQP